MATKHGTLKMMDHPIQPRLILSDLILMVSPPTSLDLLIPLLTVNSWNSSEKDGLSLCHLFLNFLDQALRSIIKYTSIFCNNSLELLDHGLLYGTEEFIRSSSC